MKTTENLHDRIKPDFRRGRKKFALYEKFYLSLSENGKKYLQVRSKEYKEILLDIQRVILPYIKKHCPACINCCKLHTPELSIYIAESVGCFSCVDYLLVRFDTRLPDPNYENAEKNLCPFWSDGCILPSDCRSSLCIGYFCETLMKELNMQEISEHLEKLATIVSNFSIQQCMV